MWSVRVLSGQQSGQIYDLRMGKNIFGRGGQSQFKVQSLGISKEHCEIHVYKDKMMIVDLKSSNGTFVNGVKIQNSLIRLGDKISLFDVIMDIIPTPDIRPRSHSKQPVMPASRPVSNSLPPTPQISIPPVPAMNMDVMQNGQQGNLAYQLNAFSQPMAELANTLQPPQNEEPGQIKESLNEKLENIIENKLMPAVYKLGSVFSFKQVLLGFVLIFIFGVTLLSIFPLTTIVAEANLIEAKKRAMSIARAMAKLNEQALISDQFRSLSVQDALKEEGVRDAFIIQHSDGAVVAPSEKAGRETTNSFILQARQESRSTQGAAGANRIGASYPIGVYDPATGEPTVKFHAIVFYDVSSLNLNQDRFISLFMQTLIISSVLGLLLYFLFLRFIEYPIRSLNQQIDQALLEKSDRTEIKFEHPIFQKLVSNVNTLLNRVLNSQSDSNDSHVQTQNKDIEFSNLVEIISHPALVIDLSDRIIAVNTNFEQLIQGSRDSILNATYQSLTDSALVQNIESLLVRAKNSPYEKHHDKIPFTQFECQIFCQAFLNTRNEAEYFVMTLVQVTEAS